MVAHGLRRIGLILGVVFLALASAAPPAGASSLCVNHGGSGGCFSTIAAAIAAAGSGDTIHIAAGSPYLEQLYIAKSLSLVGDGAATTIIDGNSLGQVVRITATITVNMTNLTIRHGHPILGYPDDLWGGGIHNEYAALTLN